MTLLSSKRALFAIALLLAPVQALAQGGITINNLQPAAPLQGSESLPVFQGTNPARRTTPSAIKTYVFSGASWGTAGGDLSGTYPNPVVKGLQGNAVSSASPAGGQCLVYTGVFPVGSWAPGLCAAASGVTSFNARTGAVIPASGDYSFSLLTGTVGCSQVASFTGDATNVACAMTIAANAVTFAKFQQIAALSMFGNCTNALANGAAVTGTANQVLRVNGAATSCGFGAIDLSQAAAATGVLQTASVPTFAGGDVTSPGGSLVLTIAANAVTNAKTATMAANTVKANATGGPATPTDVVPATARSSSLLNIDQFTGHGDSNYSIVCTDRTVGTNAAFTATRTWTLSAANCVNPGQEIQVADFQGTVTGVNQLIIARAGADTINGATSVTLSTANSAYVLRSDGVSKWTALTGAGAGSGVTSLTCGTGMTGGTITTTGTCAVSLTTASNALGADVNLNNTANYFDGPSMAQGTSGTWFVSGTVTVLSGTAADFITCKLWDGSTIISTSVTTAPASINNISMSLSGFLASPAGNIRISCKDTTTVNGVIRFNSSGSSKDSFVSGIRIQ